MWVVGLIAGWLWWSGTAHAFTHQPYYNEVIADSPVAFYQLEDPRTDDPTFVYDDSGNAHNGVSSATSGTLLVGHQTAAFSVCRYSMVNDSNGTQQHITVPDDAAFDFGTGNFTIELFWKNANSASVSGCSTNGQAITKDTKTGGFPFIACLVAGFGVGPTFQIGTDFIDLSVYGDDAWHMLDFVRTSTSNIDYYVDGTNIGSLTLTSNWNTTNAGDLVLWKNPAIGGADSTTYTVHMDNISFYNSALSAGRITAHWDAANEAAPCGAQEYPYEVKALRPSMFGFIGFSRLR